MRLTGLLPPKDRLTGTHTSEGKGVMAEKADTGQNLGVARAIDQQKARHQSN